MKIGLRWVEWITKTIRAFSDIQVCHIFRKANCVAHKLAHTTSFSAMNEFGLRRHLILLKMSSLRIFIKVFEVQALPPPRCTTTFILNEFLFLKKV